MRGKHENSKHIAARRRRIVRAIEIVLRMGLVAACIIIPICLMGWVFRLTGLN